MTTIDEATKIDIVADKLADLLYPRGNTPDLSKLSANQVEAMFKDGLLTQKMVADWCLLSASSPNCPRTYTPHYRSAPYKLVVNGIESWESRIVGVWLERVKDW